MSESALKTWYLQYVATLDGRELDKMDRFIADEVVLNGTPGRREDVVADMRSILDAVSDMRWEVDEVLIDRDRIAVRALNTGTPQKEWLGVPASGASFSIVEYAIYRVRDGRFVEMTNLHDSADILRQLAA
jgi:predicted ester cyclase